jgi:outer membrane protein assembly factor BamE (lipoprotein component of BamABCDE complex)
MKKLITIIGLVLLMGCASQPFEIGNAALKEMDKKASQIVKGSSSRKEVRRIFGEPLRITTNDQKSEEEWTYQLNTGVSDFWGSQVNTRSLLGIRFNERGIVSQIEKEHTDYRGIQKVRMMSE